MERIQFGCSPCKYRTFYEDKTCSHLDGKFHKEHFRYIGTKLSKQTADFLQEYVTNETKKTEEFQNTVEDLDGLIQQSYRDQHLTQEIAMEHFVKKVEEAHCAACDLFIPMQFGINQKHLKTMDNNQNLRGENPSPDNLEEEKKLDEVEAGTLGKGAPREATGLTEAMPAQSPVPLEPTPGTATSPPPPPPGEEESPVPLLDVAVPDPRDPGPQHGRGRGERRGSIALTGQGSGSRGWKPRVIKCFPNRGGKRLDRMHKFVERCHYHS